MSETRNGYSAPFKEAVRVEHAGDRHVFTTDGSSVSLVEFDPDHRSVREEQERHLQEVLQSPETPPQELVGLIGEMAVWARAQAGSQQPAESFTSPNPEDNDRYLDAIAA